MSDDSLAHLDFTVDEPDVIDVSQLDNYGLAQLMNVTREELHRREEMYVPAHQRSEHAKQLHSVYLACQIERQRRRTTT